MIIPLLPAILNNELTSIFKSGRPLLVTQVSDPTPNRPLAKNFIFKRAFLDSQKQKTYALFGEGLYYS